MVAVGVNYLIGMQKLSHLHLGSIALKTIKNILKSSLILLVLVLQGCVPESAYYANEAGGDDFSINDKYLRIDPLDYPVFAMKEDRDAPVNLNSSAV